MAQKNKDNNGKDMVDEAADAAREAAHSARERVDEAVRHGADVLDEARRKGAETLDSAKREAADMAANMRDEAQRLYRDGEMRVAGMAEEARLEAEIYYDELSQMVRRQPAAALGIAAGIGFLAGILISRR